MNYTYEPKLYTIGSADDINRLIRRAEATGRHLPLHGLLKEKKAEEESRNRKTVVKILNAAIKRRINVIEACYPFCENYRAIFVRYPSMIDGKWEAVNVCLKGYDRLPTAVQFDDFERCRAECVRSNDLHDIDPVFAAEVVTLSIQVNAEEAATY